MKRSSNLKRAHAIALCGGALSEACHTGVGRTLLGPTAYAVGCTNIAPPVLPRDGLEERQLTQRVVKKSPLRGFMEDDREGGFTNNRAVPWSSRGRGADYLLFADARACIPMLFT